MKKNDIMNLVAAENGSLAVNPICYLSRWTVSALGSKVDRLSVVFNDINGMGRFSGQVDIVSRDYAGIIAEVENAIRVKMQDVADYLCSALENGYTV